MERLPITPATMNQFLADFPDHEQRYQFALNHVAGLNVADLACGAGYGAAMLAKSAKMVTGFDIDLATVKHANQHFASSNCHFMPAEQLAENGPYDVITSFETLEHMSEADGDVFLQSLHRSLKPHGKLILSTPMNEGPHKHHVTPFHIREYSHAELAHKLAANGFKVVEWYGQSNAVSRQVGGKIMKSGLHRLIPAPLRQLAKRVILGDITVRAREQVALRQDDLQGAFVQLAVCTALSSSS